MELMGLIGRTWWVTDVKTFLEHLLGILFPKI